MIILVITLISVYLSRMNKWKSFGLNYVSCSWPVLSFLCTLLPFASPIFKARCSFRFSRSICVFHIIPCHLNRILLYIYFNTLVVTVWSIILRRTLYLYNKNSCSTNFQICNVSTTSRRSFLINPQLQTWILHLIIYS